MMLIRGDDPDHSDEEDEDLSSSNWIEEMAMGGHHRSTRPNASSTEFMEQRQLHRRQMVGIFILLAILWGLFIGSSNGYEGGSSIFFRVGNNGFPSSSNDDSSSKSHGPLPTNGMSPSTQQWFKAAKPKKNKHITATTSNTNLVGDSSSTTTTNGTDIEDSLGDAISPCSKTSINVVVMDPKSLKKGMDQNLFDMILDVRTSAEWRDTGHLPNATLMENLADESDIETIVERMGGLECITNPTTTIVVYCKTGKRASKAITKLIEAGFCGSALINGQGIQQWTAAGLELVHTNSAIAKCWKEKEEERNDKNDKDHT